MNNFLTAVTSFLAGAGYGTVGTDIFTGALPDTPPECSAVIQTGGSFTTNDATSTPELTILHRGRNLRNASSQISSINAEMLKDNGFRCFSGYSGRFVAQSEPGLAGYDNRFFLVYQVKYTFVTTNQLS